MGPGRGFFEGRLLLSSFGFGGSLSEIQKEFPSQGSKLLGFQMGLWFEMSQ